MEWLLPWIPLPAQQKWPGVQEGDRQAAPVTQRQSTPALAINPLSADHTDRLTHALPVFCDALGEIRRRAGQRLRPHLFQSIVRRRLIDCLDERLVQLAENLSR